MAAGRRILLAYLVYYAAIGDTRFGPLADLDAVAREAGMRVAVHEPRDRRQAAAIHLEDVVRYCFEVGHPPACDHRAVLAEQERTFYDLDLAKLLTPQRRLPACRRRELRQVPDEQAGGLAPSLAPGRHAPAGGGIGSSKPPRSAASSASSYPASA